MGSIIALDIGDKRIGVARAHEIARLPSPLCTITNNESAVDVIAKIVRDEEVSTIVVGLPRNLSGQDTGQTEVSRQFAARLSDLATIEYQDEALTSVKAEKELAARGKPFAKGDIDALAATYILEDYLTRVK